MTTTNLLDVQMEIDLKITILEGLIGRLQPDQTDPLVDVHNAAVLAAYRDCRRMVHDVLEPYSNTVELWWGPGDDLA